MSTAIALQDIEPSQRKDAGVIRHRAVTKDDSSPVKFPQEDDPWLDTPHAASISNLPLDAHPFAPTSVYWITPHGLLTKSITVLDLTKDMETPYTGMTNEYKAQVKKTLKDHSFTPALTCHRTTWLGLKYNITNDQGEHVAHWSHPWTSMGEATLTFPSESPYSSHPISLRNKTWGLRSEAFTLNSQPYFWEMDSIWHSTNMTLYKVTGSGDAEKKVEIGKYAQKWWGAFVTGGILVVDGREIEEVVACLTLVVVLKKKRQRAGERRHAGE